MTTINDYIKDAQDKFEAAGIETPDLDARLLAQHVLGWTQTKLLLNLNQMLTEAQEKDLNAAIARRVQREPVSRIIGHRGFWKSEFKVTPQTLDPRPDSEALVEAALKHVTPPPQTVLDLGTGTGCLLLSLLGDWPNATGVGLDISKEAVATAGENAGALGLASRAQFIAADWADYRPPAQVDVVISNPPYISDDEIHRLNPEVSQYDPLAALSGGADGLACYRSIAGLLKRWLKPMGWAFLEIGHTQSNDVKSILAGQGVDVLHVLPDLAGSDRVIIARRP